MMFGFIKDWKGPNIKFLNNWLLMFKRYIYIQKCKNALLCLSGLTSFISNTKYINLNIAKQKKIEGMHYKKWSPVEELFWLYILWQYTVEKEMLPLFLYYLTFFICFVIIVQWFMIIVIMMYVQIIWLIKVCKDFFFKQVKLSILKRESGSYIGVFCYFLNQYLKNNNITCFRLIIDIYIYTYIYPKL